ncbi:MAG: GTPase domain-containing protein [Alicyclobacillaceae bacterium]|nr:GTPase domain-containing protein [Alicyclobacillaceae bacterium]
MVTQVTVVGLTGAGKTMFWLRVGAHLAGRSLLIRRHDERGQEIRLRMTADEARCRLCSLGRHRTRDPQWLDLTARRWHPWLRLRLVDTAGLVADVHPDAGLRLCMAKSLRFLAESRVWFHVIDLGRLAREGNRLSEVDAALLNFGRHVPDYVIIGNKSDLPGAAEAAEVLIESCRDFPIFVVSSLYQTGFDPVTRWLRDACRRSA